MTTSWTGGTEKNGTVSSTDEITSMLDDLEARESKLSDWERGFVEDMTSLVGNGGSLNATQDAKLTEIWERVTA